MTGRAAYARGLVTAVRQEKGGVMAKTPGRSDLPAAPNPASPQDIRNVVLVGPGGAGKTALFEALVAARVPGQRTGTADHVRTTTLTVASFESGRSPSTSSTPPATPTSSATCAPACGPPTPRSSSSRAPTTSTGRCRCCGASARPSACRVPSSSPTSTSPRRLRDDGRDVSSHVRRRPGIFFLFRNPLHEQRTRDIVREMRPDIHVSISSEVDPAFREYERTVMTTLDAYLQGAVGDYVARQPDEVTGSASRRNYR